METLDDTSVEDPEATVGTTITTGLDIATAVRKRNGIIVLVVLDYGMRLFSFTKARSWGRFLTSS